MSSLLRKLMSGGSAATLLAAMPFGAAFAQEAQGNGDIEQVVVSASRITIAGYSQPTPVTVVSGAQLEQDAYSNIAESVRNLPQVTSPPVSFSSSQAASTGGIAGSNVINLRNLGLTRTLVLLDSQRVVSSSYINGGVDITTFPQSLIERVDIVTGGASAAWGSDAVAGVVNFVLNKNFTGFKASLTGSDTTDGLARGLAGNVAWGGDIDGGRGHFEFAFESKINPDTVMLTQEKWFKGAYWVLNPAFAPGNGQSQYIVGTNVGLANMTPGGLITASPAGAAGPGVTPAAANALRGIQFVGNGIPELINFGNVTNNTLSNGGTLTTRDSESPVATITQPSETYTLFGYGRYKLTDNIQASVQLNYGYFSGKAANPPALQTGATIQSDNAYLPASVAAAMRAGGIPSFTMGILDINNYNPHNATGENYFSQAEPSLGTGTQFIRRNLVRGVFALDGTIGDDWSWHAYIEHSAARTSQHFLGDPIVANLLAAEDAVTVTSANVGKSGLALGSIACRSTLTGLGFTSQGLTSQPGCIPLDVFGSGVASPAAIAYVGGTSNGSSDFQHQSLQQDVFEASMEGTLPWELPAGKVAVAFGIGYRKEAGKVDTTPLSPAYYISNFYPIPPSSYNVIEGFGEVDAPILKNNIVDSLDFTMAGRMTSYSTSGLVETWKLGATSQINDDIKLRTSWSLDIRAPQLDDLFSSHRIGVKTETDPKTQATVIIIEDTTGNPSLLPEIARTVSGGVVLTPTFIPGLSLSADWYSINLTSLIGNITDTTILNQCNATLPSVIYPGQKGNPNDPLCKTLQFNGPNGALSGMTLSEINIASQTTSGLDLAANYTMDFWEGTLAFATTDNYTDENTLCNPGSGCNDFAGSNAPGLGGSVSSGPKWKGVLAATYTTGPYSFTVQSRWFGTSVVDNAGNTGNQAAASTALKYDPAHFEVPFTAFLDLRGTYKWNDNISIYGAVDNTLNTPPPLVVPIASNTNYGSLNYYNTNQNVYEMLGRAIRVGIRLNY